MNSRRQKLVEKFKHYIDAVDLSDCQLILETFEFKRRKSPGSHQVYSDGKHRFTLVPEHGRHIKKVYKIKLRELLENIYPVEFER